MKKFVASACILSAVLLYSAGILFLGMQIGTKTRTETNQVEAAVSTPKYMVKVYQEGIWVFSGETPLRKLDINYKTLRDYDKELFTKGVAVSSLEELLKLEEDFSS